MKTNRLIFILVAALCIASCEKGLENYSGSDYIRFGSEFEADSVEYNFGLAGVVDASRIAVEVKVTGEVCDYDREYSLAVGSKSTAREGVNFSIPAANRVVRAGHVTDTLWIEVMNTPELRDGRVYLQLDLVENANFELCFPESNSCRIFLTDKVERPSWWDSWHETDGLGSYSETKYRLFVRVCGVADLGAVEYPERRDAILRFKYYLEEQADSGRQVMDENGLPMSVAMYG